MPEVLRVVVLMGSLIAIMLFLVKGARPTSGSPAQLRQLVSYGTPGKDVPWITGLMAVIAALTIVQWLGGSGVSAVGIGALIGVIYGLVGRSSLATLVSLVEAALGGLALVAVVLDLLHPNSGDAATDTTQLIMIGLIGTVYLIAVSAAFGLRIFGPQPIGAVVFGVYGTIEVLSFVANPIGVPILAMSAKAVLIGICAAALLGFATAKAPRIIVGLAVIAISLCETSLAASFGTFSRLGPDPLLLGGLVAFGIVFVVVSRIVGRIRR